MARLLQGIHGPVKGKVAGLVYFDYKGTNCVRTAPRKSTKPQSGAQVDHLTKFKFVNNFLKPFNDYIKVGLKNSAKGMSEMNKASKINFNRIFSGTAPDIIVDYAKFLWSEGRIAPPASPTIALQGSSIKINWMLTNHGSTENHNDQLILLLYCPELHLTDGVTGGTSRYQKECNFEINPIMLGKELHVYAAFSTIDQRELSDNIYLGAITVPANDTENGNS